MNLPGTKWPNLDARCRFSVRRIKVVKTLNQNDLFQRQSRDVHEVRHLHWGFIQNLPHKLSNQSVSPPSRCVHTHTHTERERATKEINTVRTAHKDLHLSNWCHPGGGGCATCAQCQGRFVRVTTYRHLGTTSSETHSLSAGGRWNNWELLPKLTNYTADTPQLPARRDDQ